MSSFAEWENEKMKPSSKNNNLVLILFSWNNIRILKTFSSQLIKIKLDLASGLELNTIDIILTA